MFKEFHEAHQADMDFCLEQDHYREPVADDSKDRRRVKPRTADLFGIVRHKAAEISRSEIYLDVRPIPQPGLDSPLDDQRTSEIEEGAKTAELSLQHVIHHPRYGYDEPRDLMVVAGLAARVGCVAVEFDPRKRPYGEIVFRIVRFQDLVWAPGTRGPHDPYCWGVIERRRMTRDQLASMKRFGWKNTDRFSESAAGDTLQGNDPTLPPGAVRLSTPGLPDSGKSNSVKFLNVLFFWRIEDDQINKSEKYEPIDPQSYYLACPECGYEEHIDSGEHLPKSAPCPMPGCNGTMHRIEMRAKTTESLAYPAGRLTIVPEEGEDVTFYDGPPDCPTRAHRFITFEPYPHPYKTVGMSDTRLHKSMQLILDSTLRLAYEQMSENRHLIVTLEDGLVDAHGEPWQFSDAQGRVAFARDLATLSGIREFQGQAVPNGWGEFVSVLRNSFVPNFGITDIYLDPGNTKNIPVGTLERMQQTKELPVLHHVERLRRRESIFFGVVLDLIRYHWTERRWVDQMGPEGKVIYALIRGATLPDANVTVTASPTMSKIEQDQAQSLQIVYSAFHQSPAIGKAMAKALGIPPDQIAELQQDLQSESQSAIINRLVQNLKGLMTPDQIAMILQAIGLTGQPEQTTQPEPGGGLPAMPQGMPQGVAGPMQ